MRTNITKTCLQHESFGVYYFRPTSHKSQPDCAELKNRLVNLNACIYGKVYFPSRSNNLKALGKLVGASWTAPDASGLQSLVWRHRWEETRESQYQERLVTYNREDCEALWLLTEELSKIIANADAHVNIDFVDRPKQHATELGNEIHGELQNIIRYAHADYVKKRVRIRAQESTTGTERKKKGGVNGHQAYLEFPQKIICGLANAMIARANHSS